MRRAVDGLFGGLALAVAVSTAGVASATDGKFWGKNDNGAMKWSDLGYWYNQTYANDGGIAWFTSSQLDEMNVDVDNVKLTGLSFDIRWMHFTGSPLTFSAPYSWIAIGNDGTTSHKPGFDVPFRGVGDNTVTINDRGKFHMLAPAENVGNLRLMGGRAMAWNAVGDCFTTGDLQLLESRAEIAPQIDAGGYAEVTVASAAGKKFVYGPSLGCLQVAKGAGDSTTLTIGTLERFAGGGVMAIEAASGLSNLGGSEKVKVASGAPENVNGICDASIVGAATVSPYPFSFLAYDAADGFKPTSAPSVGFASAGANDVALISDDATISGTKHVHALYVNGQPMITFADGAVLKVGDGTHPAGIIFNSVDGNRIQPTLAGSNGTFDFGGSLGCIYFNNPNNESTLTINQKIAGSGGVVFAGSFNGKKEWFELKQPAGWTGSTVVTRATLLVEGADQLPEDGDVYVLGGRNASRQACLRLTTSLTFGEKQRFHFGGWGIDGDNYGAAIHTGGYKPEFNFDGPVELNGPGGFVNDGEDNKLIFNGTVSGGGYWNFGKGEYTFTKPMTYAGIIRLTKRYDATKASKLVFTREGRPNPKAAIEYLDPSGTITFQFLVSELDFTNTVTGGGNLVVHDAEVKLNGNQTYGTITVGEGAKVGIGANVKFDNIVPAGGEVYALEGVENATVRIGGAAGADTILNGGGQLSEELGVVKHGGNTVTIARDSNVNKSLHITEGTVKLDDSILMTAGVSYWLDAANEATVTADADGNVSKWVSALDGVSAFNATAKKPTYTKTVNGRRVMSFHNDGSTYCRFNSVGTFVQKSVFFCLAPNYPERGAQTMSAWGWTNKGNPEYGLRFETWNGTWGTLNYGTDLRMNGGKKFNFTPDGTMQIVSEFNSSGSNDTFPISVGGYESWSTANNYNGDICEIIAFDYILNQDQIKEVENYLSEKWGMTDVVWHEDVAMERQVLGEGVAVSLDPVGTLDLNGVNQTIGSLSGEGTITNSSEKPAVLTVTGACDFRGRIVGNVTVRTAAGGALAVDVPDATVEVAGGVTKFGPYAEMPPLDGIIYWMDASWDIENSVTWKDEAAKTVASVKSRAGIVENFPAAYGCPIYVENALGGNKPTFQFTGESGTGVASFKTDRAVTTKSIVLVMQLPDATCANNYFWGKFNADRGMRLTSIYSLGLGYSLQDYGWGFSGTGDYRWLNGEKKQIGYNVGGFNMAVGEPIRFIATRADWHRDTHYDNVINGIGSYENRDSNMYISEAIAYDHALTDDEVAALDGYLKAKWFSEGTIPAVRTQVFGAAATLAADGGEADLSEVAGTTVRTLKAGANGGTVTGDLAISGFAYDAAGATEAVPLCVKGALAIANGADFSAVNLGDLRRKNWQLLTSDASTGSFDGFSASPRKWTFMEAPNAWGIAIPGFLLMVK